MPTHTTKSERRERKKRRRQPVTGKHVFTLQQLMSRPGGRKHGRQHIRGSHRVNKPRHGQH